MVVTLDNDCYHHYHHYETDDSTTGAAVLDAIKAVPLRLLCLLLSSCTHYNQNYARDADVGVERDRNRMFLPEPNVLFSYLRLPRHSD